MKFRKIRLAGMSRAGVLALVCVAVFAAYVVGRYQETGEIIFLKWTRKAKAPANSASEPLQTPVAKVFEQMDATEASTVEPRANRSLSVSTQRNEATRDAVTSSGATEARLDDWQKKRVAVPTNAVWSQTRPRKSPGIRIAFP